MTYDDCNCRNYAPLISKYLVNEEDDVIREPVIDKSLVHGKLPNYGYGPKEPNTGIVGLPDNHSNIESIVREGYASPIKLDTNYKTGEVRLVKLDIDQKNGQSKLIPLEVDPKTGKEKFITLDVDHKTKEAALVRLDTDEKTGKAKLVRLEVPQLSKDSRLVLLEVNSIKTEPKLVQLEVDHKTNKAKLINLNVIEKEVEPKVLMLDVNELIPDPKIIELEVKEKSKLPKLIPLNVNEIAGTSKLVRLLVNEKTGEAKIVDLNVPEIKSEAKIVNLNVNQITGEAKIVNLAVDYKVTDPKLVPLHVDPKSKDGKIVELEVEDKTENPKMINLDVTQKDGQVKVVELDVPDILGSTKLVMLEVDPKTGNSKLVPLHVDPKSKDGKIVELEVEDKTENPKLILLEVKSKEGQVKVIKLDIPEKLGDTKLIKLEVDYKIGEAKIIPLPNHVDDLDSKNPVGAKTVNLNVESIDLPKGEVVNTPQNTQHELDLSKYITYIPGTEIPLHSKSAGSMIKPEIANRTGLNLTPEAKAKYEATAAWMGIPGKIGVKAAQDYESIIGIYNSLDYQLGGGNEAIERIKSYLTASVSGKGNDFMKGIPSHELEGLENNSLVRTGNAVIRNTIGSSELASRITGAGLSILGGDINGAIKSIFGKTGEAKAEAIHDTLRMVRDAYNKLLISTKTEPGRLPGIEGNSAVSKLAQGDLIGAATDAAGQALKKLLGIGSGSNKGRSARSTPNNHPDARNIPIGWKGNPYEEDRKVTDPDYGSYDNGNVNFMSRMDSEAMKTTLKEVISTSAPVGDLTTLRAAMNNSDSLITSYQAHLNSMGGSMKGIGDIGLDSNHVWAVSLEPLISPLNGGYTFLPSIEIMSKENYKQFNVETNYTRWLPWTSFELQSGKMTGKSIGLFDGGVMFPVSMEFANELRMTLVDDNLKTFRRYFDTIAKVSVYKSNATKAASQYGYTLDNLGIDETKPHVSCYKNITFKLTIYVMNGEYMTIKKFPLLVVLNDYQLEYSGEVESGSGDISLHFSIVGEDDSSGDKLVAQYQSDVQGKIDSLYETPRNEKYNKAMVNNSAIDQIKSSATNWNSPSTLAGKPITI